MSLTNRIVSLLSTIAIAGGIATAVSATEIELTLKNDGITISGELTGFERNAYVMETAAGEIFVPAEYVSCIGENCLIVLSGISTNN